MSDSRMGVFWHALKGVAIAIAVFAVICTRENIQERMASSAISRDIMDAGYATKFVIHLLGGFSPSDGHPVFFPEYNAVLRGDLTLYGSGGNRVFSVTRVGPIDHGHVSQIDHHDLPHVIASTGLYEWFGTKFITGQPIVVRTGRASATGPFQLYVEFEGVGFVIEERLFE